MAHYSSDPSLLVTPRQKALFKILMESGFTESGTDAEGRSFEGGPPYGMALMLDMTLSSFPSEDELLATLTWGDRGASKEARPIARRIMALINDDGSSAA